MADENTATDTTNTDGGVVEQQNAQEATANKQGETPDMTIDDYKAALKRANGEAAKFRSERNELRADAEKYREMQEAEKTELQRAQEALEAERAKANQFQVELARSQALAKYGIAEDNADLLGNDPEKFEANAQRLGELQQQAAKRQAPPSDYPVENLKPGASDKDVKPDLSYPSSWNVTGPFAKN